MVKRLSYVLYICSGRSKCLCAFHQALEKARHLTAVQQGFDDGTAWAIKRKTAHYSICIAREPYNREERGHSLYFPLEGRKNRERKSPIQHI